MHIDEQMSLKDIVASVQEAERNAETMDQMSDNTHTLKFRQIVIVKTKEWVFEKNLSLPFVPFTGLVVHEPFGTKDGKKTFMPWKIAAHDKIEYMNDGEDGYFFIEKKEYTDDHEPFLKRLLSWGYTVVKVPE